MKIALHSQNGTGVGNFAWEVPPPIEQAKDAVEVYGHKHAPEQVDDAVKELITDIENKITVLLWTITAAHCLGGKEGVLVLNNIDASLNTLRAEAAELMCKKSGGV